MISGSVALNVYTIPRMTRDADLVVNLTPQNVSAFLAALSPDAFYFVEGAIRDAVARRDMFNLIDLRRAFKLDFMVLKDSEFRRLELSRRREAEVAGKTVWIVSPEDLLLSKLFWARSSRSEVQLGDARNLIASIELDWEYLRNWAATLGIGELLEEFAP